MSDETAVVRTIGRYQVLDELGRGAMGVVYRGFDPVIRRTVALKTIAFGSDPAEAAPLRERLYREASAAGTLTHPNIVTIYDIVEEGGTTAVAMEYVEGQPLSALIGQSGALPPEHALTIFEHICSALDYAGSRGIIHRDIKPANILLTPDGRAKILDFGIARISTSGITQTSTIMGSPSYMSPEQVRGLPLDPRSDLFSAAVVLYEMLTGERPFGGDDVATTMYRIVNEPPRAVEHANPAVNLAVASVLQWALAKNPADRFQSGADLADALRRAMGAAPADVYTDAAPAAAPVEAPPGKRSPALLVGVIGSGVLLVAVVIAIVLGRGSVPEISGAAGGVGGGADPTAGQPPAQAAVRPPEPAPPASSSSDPGSAVPQQIPTASASRAPTGSTASTRAPSTATAAAAAPPKATGTGNTSDMPGRRPAPAAEPAATPPAAATVATPVKAALPTISAPEPATRPSPPVPTPAAGTPAVSTPATRESPPGSGDAVLRVDFDGQPYPVTLFAGDARLGRVEGTDGSVSIEAGSVRLRAINETIYLDADLGVISLRPGERRTLAVPGLASAVFGVRGEDYAGVRLSIDGRQVPGPYPAQIGRIAAGSHQVVYRWTTGASAGREVTDTVTLKAGGHFVIRAVVDNEKLVVQQLR